MKITSTPIQQDSPPPSRQKLDLLLKNGIDFVDMVNDLITKHKLPYTISERGEEIKEWFIKDTLSPGELHLGKFLTIHEDTIAMKEKALKASKTMHEVLIYGPTGTGKEIIAKSMIYNRANDENKTLAINCAAMPENLIEAELFGYTRGAFTGADTNRQGLIHNVGGGVMFLDEVGELPLPMQAKLLRVIQERTVRKVGGKEDEEVKCKFVFATNRDLEKMVEEHKFREDLYARISTLTLNIQGLRPSRTCDIIPICKSLQGGDKFLEAFGEQLENGSLLVPYNVRSLQQYIIRYNVWGCIN